MRKPLAWVSTAAAVLVAAAALTLTTPLAASAHVTVTPSSSTAGGRSILTFRVPTESDTASTVSLTIHLPTDTPFISVRIKPVAGWTAQLTETTLPAPVKDDDGNTITSAITEIVWTATDAGLAPGEYGEFDVSVNPLPESGTVFFPTVQTYSDGSHVDWVQQTADGDAEPEHPAPKITIEGTDAAATPAARVTASAEGDGTGAAEASASTGSAGGWGIGLGVAGIVIALAASGLAGAAIARTRR